MKVKPHKKLRESAPRRAKAKPEAEAAGNAAESLAGQEGAGRYNYEGLDRLLHEKARLGILTSLASHPEGLLFNELKELCALTDGNLSRHMQTLEEAGLVEVWKGYRRRRPQTLCRLSREGRERFMDYLAELERVIGDAQAARDAANAGERELPEGWVPA